VQRYRHLPFSIQGIEKSEKLSHGDNSGFSVPVESSQGMILGNNVLRTGFCSALQDPIIRVIAAIASVSFGSTKHAIFRSLASCKSYGGHLNFSRSMRMVSSKIGRLIAISMSLSMARCNSSKHDP
jgi:hypothetical protein